MKSEQITFFLCLLICDAIEYRADQIKFSKSAFYPIIILSFNTKQYNDVVLITKRSNIPRLMFK